MSAKQIKTIGYFRTSADDDQKVSIQLQQSDYLKAVALNGWVDCGTYTDKGISGRAYPSGAALIPFDTVTTKYLNKKQKGKTTRQGLADAMAFAKVNKIDYIVVRDITRLQRPVAGGMLSPYIIGQFSDMGLLIYALDSGVIDYSKLDTRIVRNLQDDLEDNAIKTKFAQAQASIIEKRDMGLLYTRADCYGFRSAFKGQVNAVESELAVIKGIFKDFLSGKSIRQITIALNDKEIKPYAADFWGRKSVTNILKRSWYAGLQPDSKGILIDSVVFGHYAVVSKSDFLKIQNRLEKNDSAVIRRESKFYRPLSGLIRCGYCGSIMYPLIANTRSSNPQYYYRCKNNHSAKCETKSTCNQSLIRETFGIPARIGQQDGYLSAQGKGTGLLEFLYPLCIPAFMRQLQAADTMPSLNADKSELVSKIDSLKKLTVSRYKDLESGYLDRDTYAALTKETKQQESEVLKQLKAVETKIQESASRIKLTPDMRGQLKNMPAPMFADLIKTVIESVTVYADKVVINIHPDLGWKQPAITVNRIPFRNQMQLPKPAIAFQEDDTETMITEIIISYPQPDTKPVTLFFD